MSKDAKKKVSKECEDTMNLITVIDEIADDPTLHKVYFQQRSEEGFKVPVKPATKAKVFAEHFAIFSMMLWLFTQLGEFLEEEQERETAAKKAA